MKIKEVLSKNKYYRLEVGKDGKVLGGLFRYANTLMKQIDKMDPDYEDTYGDDVMDSIDKLDFDLKVPDVNWNGEDKEVVRCAFTQETFNKHRDTIDTLQTALEHFGYQLIKKEVQPDEDAIIYEDKDQIVYWDDMANIKPFLESFANHLDKDILEVIKDNRTTTNYVKQGKCSKTSGFNLLKAYKDPRTKDIKLYVGHLKPSNQEEEHTNTIAHMWIEVDGTIYATNEPKGFDRVVTDTLTIDKDKDLYSQVENFLSMPSLTESLTESNNYGYHAGDLGKSEYYGSQSSSRGTGHFGTGTYFVGDPNRIKGYNDYNYGKGEAPHHIVDFSSYNLYKPSTNQKGYDLHDALKVLDGSYTYWKDKVDDVNIVKKYEGREKRRYDKFTEQELEELIGALNRLDSDEPLNYEYISNFLVPENFDKYYEELILADLDTDGAFDDQYEVQEQLYDKVQEWTDWRVLNAVSNVSNIENKLYQALEGRVSMSRIKQGLDDVVKTEKQYEANRDKKVDSLATVFMKSLGYEGIDTRHLNKDDKEQALAGLDNTGYGSVIYDVKPNTIVESFEGKTFSLPKELVDKCIDYYKETYPIIKVDKLSIEQLVKDNDLLNDEDLQSYHQRQWDNKSAKEFSINQDKINSMRVSEVPFVVKKKDKLELVDGRHRVRALYNDGYNYVELPVVEESLIEGLTSEVDSEGNPLTKEQVEFFKNSKVRDTDGTLLLVYHGSKSSFNTFDKSKIKPWGWYGNGFYFTPSPNIASTYSEGYTLTCYLNITNPFYADSSFTNKEEYYNRCDKLYELVGITKEEVDKQDEECSYTSDPYYKLLMYLQHTKATRDINDYVKELGYDGVIGLDTEGEYPEIVAFEPNQIKAITNKAPSNSDNINEDLEQLHNYIEDNYGTNNLPKASSYILENGKYVDILGKGLEYHGDLDDELVSTFPEDEDIMNYVDEDGFIPMNLVKKLFPNIIKMNNGSRDVDSMFIELSDNVPTEEQLDSLIRWSLKLPKDNIVIYNHKNNIQAYVPTNKITKDYIKSLYGVKEDYEMKVNTILTEGKQDIENFKKWIENTEDSPARYMSGGNKEAYVNNFVNTFNEERKNLKAPYNDYYYWIKQNDWNAFTKMIADQGEKKASKQREKEGAKLIYSDDNWKVYEITTYEASKKYGANTKWCISGSKRWTNGGNGMRFWDDYTREGVKFYFFINKDTKYALALYPDHKTFEIFDAQDNAISYIPDAPVVKEIKVDYFTRDDNRLLLNYIKTGQLPRICDLLSDYMLEKNDIDLLIFSKDNFEEFLNTVKVNVNPDWVRWMAVDEGVLTKEQYEEETGDEYREDYWGGDTTMYLEDDLSFYNGYATLDDALTKDNPAFDYDSTEYFISDLYNNRLKLCKDWVAVWMYISEYVDDNELLEFAREWARENNMVDEYQELGLSRAYLLDESLQENLREDKDTVEFLYHGSPSPTLNLERDSTLWLAEDYGYAIGFGPYLHICSAYIPNILEVGDTDGYIRGLIPTQFSKEFTEIANKLNMQPKELLRACGEDCKNIYSLVRTKQFRKICMEKGYDAVETEEFGNICYGVFNRHNVELIDTEDKEDESSPLDEAFSYTDRTNVNNLTNLDRQYFDYIYTGQSKKAKEILNKLALDWGALSNGNTPLELYHGTPSRFTKFDAKQGFNVDAIYFSNSQSVAAHWSARDEYGKGVGIRGFAIDEINDLVDAANRDPNKLLDILNNHLYYQIGVNVVDHDDEYGDNYRLETPVTSSPLGYKKTEEIYFQPELPQYGVKYKEHNLVDELLHTIEYVSNKAFYQNNTLACYLKMEKPLVVDAKGSTYYEVEFEGKKTNTETISSIAKKRGYDGVIVKNVYETDLVNIKCDDYIVFEPNQIKSCNLIVTDDEGDIIPPSKRFTTSDDIREEMQEH